jgi:hypothetical protein
MAVRHQRDAALADGAHGASVGRQRLRAHGVARTKRLRLPQASLRTSASNLLEPATYIMGRQMQ